MAHSKQAKKRIRQNAKRRQQNKSVSSSMKTHVKKVLAAVAAGDADAAKASLVVAISDIDKAAKQRVIHPNAAARKKSQVARAVNTLAK